MELNLRVNNYPIVLKQSFDESELRKHNFKKIGFFGRIFIKPDKNEVVVWAKNPSLKYLNDDFQNVIRPILDVKAGAHSMFGTSAYLWFRQNGLIKFTFQIIQNKTIAEISLKKLETKLVPLLKPTSSNGVLVTWEMENQKLILEYPQRMHGYIHLMNE